MYINRVCFRVCWWIKMFGCGLKIMLLCSFTDFLARIKNCWRFFVSVGENMLGCGLTIMWFCSFDSFSSIKEFFTIWNVSRPIVLVLVHVCRQLLKLFPSWALHSHFTLFLNAIASLILTFSRSFFVLHIIQSCFFTPPPTWVGLGKCSPSFSVGFLLRGLRPMGHPSHPTPTPLCLPFRHPHPSIYDHFPLFASLSIRIFSFPFHKAVFRVPELKAGFRYPRQLSGTDYTSYPTQPYYVIKRSIHCILFSGGATTKDLDSESDDMAPWAGSLSLDNLVLIKNHSFYIFPKDSLIHLER